MENQYFKTKASAGEIGAGLGLMFFCTVLIFISPEAAPALMMPNVLGLMIALGLFSEDKGKSKKSCNKKAKPHNPEG